MLCEKNDKEINELLNILITGYKYVICNPTNHEKLSKKFPDITFTLSRYVEDNTIIYFEKGGNKHEKTTFISNRADD